MIQKILPQGKGEEAASQQHLPDIPLGGHTAHTPYPDYDVVERDKWRLDWDEKTRRLVLDRLYNVPSYRFFTGGEVRCLEAVCDRLFPQEDRPPDQRIPIAPWIDDRLFRDRSDGYRYDGMPPDQEAYRHGLQGIQETADAIFEQPFEALSGVQQDAVLWRVAAGNPPGIQWQALPPDRFFDLLVQDAITEYYAHPTAWAEIGFSGPASPRGHIRLAPGMRDPWEAEERVERSSVEIVTHALLRKEADA